MMKVTGVSGFGPVIQDGETGAKLYLDDLGISFEEVYEDYRFTEHLAGARHFSLMPLSRLAESLFANRAWPRELAVPQAWIEFEVEDIEAATKELEDRGHDLLVRARKEPWGQVLTRFLTPDGLMVGIVRNP
jgi:catechol 2,3-dioxygenase-like lactoylglutathione lyase family enzyme